MIPQGTKSSNSALELGCEEGRGVRLPGSSRVGQGPVGVELTLPEVTKVEQLVVPLCENAQRVLEEGHHDQEATDRGEVPEQVNTVSVHASRSLVWGAIGARSSCCRAATE